MTTSKDKRYYDIQDDMDACPDAWCYIIVGGRKRGKTYGALRKYLNEKKTTVFLKRTNDDVRLLCSGNSLTSKTGEYEIDTSPYKSINRDLGTKIKAFKIDEGIGAFYATGDEGQAVGRPISYLLSLNANKKVKGMDLSECDAMIFDEFIPMFGEKVNRKEGELVLDMYETVSRDRVDRGRDDLKLICLANATDIYNPMCAVLEIIDDMSEMMDKGQESRYIESRGIFIHIVPQGAALAASNARTGIYKAMKDTAWGKVSYENEFAYNDFSRVRKKMSLKGASCVAEFRYREKDFYLYLTPSGEYYACTSRGAAPASYDLKQELSAKAFYYDVILEVMAAGMEQRAWFQSYVLYDLFANYKQRFKV